MLPPSCLHIQGSRFTRNEKKPTELQGNIFPDISMKTAVIYARCSTEKIDKGKEELTRELFT